MGGTPVHLSPLWKEFVDYVLWSISLHVPAFIVQLKLRSLAIGCELATNGARNVSPP